MRSEAYKQGYNDGYAAVMSETPVHSPGYHEQPGDYFVGWDAGVKQARSDWWADKEEQSYYDWQAGL